MQLVRVAVVVSLSLVACGDNLAPEVDPEPQPLEPTCDEAQLPATLAALPNVVAATETPCGDYVAAGARCFLLDFDQPIEHVAPGGARFAQRLYLAHRGCDRPVVVADWGYSQDFFYDDELTTLFRANSLWIEHRFQGASLPAESDWRWEALTIENGAADMHEVIAAFRLHYGGRFVSTGASKGGITATYHKFLHDDDVDGSVPYVAPASRDRVDPLYQDYLAAELPEPCASRVRDAQVAALTTRRPMMLQRLASQSPGYEALMLEYMTSHFDWAFWQYYGAGYCNRVPTDATPDDAFYNFMAIFSGFEAAVAAPPALDETFTYGALWYEWLTQQGFALQINPAVDALLAEPAARMTMADQFQQTFPDVALPAYDGSLTAATRRWVRNHAEDVVLVYGEYDPWSGGAMDQPVRASSARYFVPGATHGAQLAGLPDAELDEAIEHLARIFGERPSAGKADARRAGATRQAIADAQQQHLRALEWRLKLRR